MNKDRFNLEQEIMDCWNVVTDINTVFEAVVEKDLTKDQIANILLGMQELYQIKFDKMFCTFEEVIRNGGFNKPEQY